MTPAALLPGVVSAVEAAAEVLRRRFSAAARPSTPEALRAAIDGNDEASLAVLRPALRALHPTAGWVEDEEAGGALPPGDWWVVDPAEGNINHVHGRPAWGVTASLVRDGVPELTVVRLPLTGQTFTAVRGQGAFVAGAPLRVSQKTELRAALVGTGQARPFEPVEVHRLLGRSVTAMLGRALLVNVSGGRVTDTRGRPWTVESEDFLAAAPGIHAAAVEGLNLDAG